MRDAFERFFQNFTDQEVVQKILEKIEAFVKNVYGSRDINN